MRPESKDVRHSCLPKRQVGSARSSQELLHDHTFHDRDAHLRRVTQLDFTGPHQVFSRLLDSRIVLASVDGSPVSADGLTFSSLANLGDVVTCELLYVPGGNGCTQAICDPRYMAEIARLAAKARYLTSVCSGSLILEPRHS